MAILTKSSLNRDTDDVQEFFPTLDIGNGVLFTVHFGKVEQRGFMGGEAVAVPKSQNIQPSTVAY